MQIYLAYIFSEMEVVPLLTLVWFQWIICSQKHVIFTSETIYTEYRGPVESFITWCNDNHVRSTSTKSMSLCWTTAVYLLVFTFTKRNKNSFNDSACEHIQGKDWFYTLQNMEASDTHVQLCTDSRWALSPVQYLIKYETWSQSPFCSWFMGLYEDLKSVDLLIWNVITSSFWPLTFV